MNQWLVGPVYRHVLGDETAFDKFHAECPLTYLTYQSFSTHSNPQIPLSVDFFRSLPAPPSEPVWGTYNICSCYKSPVTRNGFISDPEPERLLAFRFDSKSTKMASPCPNSSGITRHRGIRLPTRGCCAGVDYHRISQLALPGVRMVVPEAALGYIFVTCLQTSIDRVSGKL